MNSKNQPDQAQYRPVSRKYLRYLIEGLNQEDSGPGIFAQLSERLVHRRKCANIVPATEPSAGGDYGQDTRTHRVLLDSEGRFRLYMSPPITQERWIFAFSIRKDWKAKLESDVATVIANNLQPDRIVFVTNQFISPERTKIDAEREIGQRHGVPCEILDGSWILHQLYEDDYALAVDFFGCPPECDPQLMEMFRRVYGLEESGITEQESLELENLKQRVQYRNRYTDIPEHLVQDLRRIGDILSSYEAHLEEAISWYEEALPELDHLRSLPDGIELLYAYFTALFKLPNGPPRIFEWLPRFIDMVLECDARSMYHYVTVWLCYLLPHLHGDSRFDKLYRDTLARFQSLDRSRMGILSQAYADEAILYLELNLHVAYEQDEDPRDWLQRVSSFLMAIGEIQAFPVHRTAGSLGALAPVLGGIPEYEDCFELALELESKQEGGMHQATILKDRALAHAQSDQLRDAIIMATRAKRLWLNEKSIRGCLLTIYMLSSWYDQIRYLQAAEYELLEGVHLATWQPVYMHPDILTAMIVELTNLALRQGRVLRAYRWLAMYYPLCRIHRLEPDAGIYDTFLDYNLGMLMVRLYSRNRPVHDQLLTLVNSFAPDALSAHTQIFLSSDEQFETWIADLSAEGQSEAREMRRQVQTGEIESLDEWVEYDELASEQSVEWRMPVPCQDTLTIRISYPRSPQLAMLAFTLAAVIQIWWAFLQDQIQQLTFADDYVRIILDLVAETAKPVAITIRMERDGLCISADVAHTYVDKVSDISSEAVLDLVIELLGSLLQSVVLDPPSEVTDLLGPDKSGDAIQRILVVAPPAYLWQHSPFVSRVLGEDYAA